MPDDAPPPAAVLPPRPPRRRRARSPTETALLRFYRKAFLALLAALAVTVVVLRERLWVRFVIQGAIVGGEKDPLRRVCWGWRLGGTEEGLEQLRDYWTRAPYAETVIRDADVPFFLPGHPLPMKRTAARALGRMVGNREAEEILARLLDDPAIPVRPEVAASLAAHRDPSHRERFERLLDPAAPPALRRAAAKALGDLGLAASLPRLREAAGDADDAVAEEALVALARFPGREETLGALGEALKSPRARLREKALMSLQILADGGGIPEGARARVADRARPLLRDASTAVRREAAPLLGKLKDEASLPEVAGLLLSPDRETIGAAARAVADYGPSALPALREMIRGLPDRRRREVAWLLGSRIPSRETIDLLLDLLGDRDPYVRERANLLLERLTGNTEIHFYYPGPEEQRRADQARWRAWWAENRDRRALRRLDIMEMRAPWAPP